MWYDRGGDINVIFERGITIYIMWFIMATNVMMAKQCVWINGTEVDCNVCKTICWYVFSFCNKLLERGLYCKNAVISSCISSSHTCCFLHRDVYSWRSDDEGGFPFKTANEAVFVFGEEIQTRWSPEFHTFQSKIFSSHLFIILIPQQGTLPSPLALAVSPEQSQGNTITSSECILRPILVATHCLS